MRNECRTCGCLVESPYDAYCEDCLDDMDTELDEDDEIFND